MTRKGTAIFSVLVILLAGSASCGKKAPPYLAPAEPVSAWVTDLDAQWVGATILLRGNVRHPESGGRGEKLSGVRVFSADYPQSSPPCEGCPLGFRRFVDFGREAFTPEGIECRLEGKDRSRIYYFRVHLLGDKGAPGPPSRVIKVAPPVDD